MPGKLAARVLLATLGGERFYVSAALSLSFRSPFRLSRPSRLFSFLPDCARCC